MDNIVNIRDYKKGHARVVFNPLAQDPRRPFDLVIGDTVVNHYEHLWQAVNAALLNNECNKLV